MFHFLKKWIFEFWNRFRHNFKNSYAFKPAFCIFTMNFMKIKKKSL